MDDSSGFRAAHASDIVAGHSSSNTAHSQYHVESGGGGSERWNSALSNISEIESGVNMLQRLLLKQTVYKDEEAFAQAASSANQARHLLAQERRIRALEKELDAAIASAGLARAEKRLAEAAQRSAEARTQEVLQELENTTQVFKLHMEELRIKQEELLKKDADMKVLQAIVQELSGANSQKSKDDPPE